MYKNFDRFRAENLLSPHAKTTSLAKKIMAAVPAAPVREEKLPVAAKAPEVKPKVAFAKEEPKVAPKVTIKAPEVAAPKVVAKAPEVAPKVAPEKPIPPPEEAFAKAKILAKEALPSETGEYKPGVKWAPEAGKKPAYQGDVIINGRRMANKQAKPLIEKFIGAPEEQAKLPIEEPKIAYAKEAPAIEAKPVIAPKVTSLEAPKPAEVISERAVAKTALPDLTNITTLKMADDRQVPLAYTRPVSRPAATRDPMSVLRATPEELNSSKISWTDVKDGVFSKPVADIKSAQKDLLKDPTPENVAKATELQKQQDAYSTKRLEINAKAAIAKYPANSGKAFDAFVKKLNDTHEEITGKALVDVDNYPETQQLRHQFLNLAYSQPSRNILLEATGDPKAPEYKTDITVGSPKRTSFLSDRISDHNFKNNANIQIVSLNKSSKFQDFIPEENKAEVLVEQLWKPQKDGSRYIPLGLKSNDVNSLLAVSYDPKLVTRFDDTAIADGTESFRYGALDPKATLPPEQEKFARVFLRDVVGLDVKNLKTKDLSKRLSVLDSNEVPSQIPAAEFTNQGLSPTIRYIIVDDPTTYGDTGTLKRENFRDLNEDGWKAINAKKVWDGDDYITPDIAKFESHYSGFSESMDHQKATAVHAWEDGNENPRFFLHKSDTAVMDSALRKDFTEKFGLDHPEIGGIRANDHVTSLENVKIGKNEGKKIITGTGHAVRLVEIPINGVRLKYEKPSDFIKEGRYSIVIPSKFSNADGVNDALVKIFTPQIEGFKQTTKDVRTDIQKAYKDHPEVFKHKEGDEYNPEDDFVGAKKDMLRLGADSRFLGHEIEGNLGSAFKNNVMNPPIKTSFFKTKSDFKFYDPETGETRYLRRGEAMLSRKALNEMGIKDGDIALLHTYPTPDRNIITPVRVLEAEKYGKDYLKGTHIVLNVHDMLVMERDADGDNIFVASVGGKNGVPQEMFDAMVKSKKKGDAVTTPEDVVPYPETNFSVASTVDNMKGQLKGVSGVNAVASRGRILNSMIDNDVSIIVSAGNEKTRQVELRIGGKTVNRGDFSNLPSLKKDVTLHFSNDPAVGKFLKATNQHSVDAIKDAFLKDNTEGQNMFTYVVKHMLKAEGAPEDVSRLMVQDPKTGAQILDNEKLIRGAVAPAFKDTNEIFPVSDPTKKYELLPTKEASPMTHIINKINVVNDWNKKVLANGGKLSPPQEIFTKLDGLSYPHISDKQLVSIAKETGDILKKEETPEITGILKSSKTVKNFIGILQKAQQDAKNVPFGKTLAEKEAAKQAKAVIRNNVIQKYDQISGSLAPEEKNALIFHMLTTDDGNFAKWPGVAAKFYQPYLDIMADNPEMTKKFFDIWKTVKTPEEGPTAPAPKPAPTPRITFK